MTITSGSARPRERRSSRCSAAGRDRRRSGVGSLRKAAIGLRRGAAADAVSTSFLVLPGVPHGPWFPEDATAPDEQTTDTTFFDAKRPRLCVKTPKGSELVHTLPRRRAVVVAVTMTKIIERACLEA